MLGSLTIIATSRLILLALATGAFWLMGGDIPLVWWSTLTVATSIGVPLSVAVILLNVNIAGCGHPVAMLVEKKKGEHEGVPIQSASADGLRLMPARSVDPVRQVRDQWEVAIRPGD